MKYKPDNNGYGRNVEFEDQDSRYDDMIGEVSAPRGVNQGSARHEGTAEMYEVSATVGHVVDELNGLLFDIKNVAVESENNIVENLHTLNDNLKRIRDALVSVDNRVADYQEEAAEDRGQLMNDVAFIKGVSASGAPVAYGGYGGSFSQAGAVEDLRAEVMEFKNTVREELDGMKRDLIEEVRAFRDHMLIMGMARVNENGEETYETYNEILLSELRSLKDDVDSLTLEAASAPVVAYVPEPEPVAQAAPAPAPEKPQKAAPAPKPKTNKMPVKRQPLKPRKVVTPVVNNDLSISEILNKINATDVKIDK